jgi:hypothetical protein
MKPIQIAVVNASSLPDEDVADGLVALQRQVSEDFAPVWGVDAELRLVPSEAAFSGRAKFPDRWGLVLEDHELVRARLGNHVRGYHDRTSGGLPIARVMVNEMGPGQDWTLVASHELLEMLADPDCNAAVFRHPDATTLLFYAREVCDPCAAYEDGYEKCGRIVSDFVFPSWFHPSAPARGATRFDERGLIDEPFKVRPHGYIGVYQAGTGSWMLQTYGGVIDFENQVGSRLEKRNTAGNRWLDSDMLTAP